MMSCMFIWVEWRKSRILWLLFSFSCSVQLLYVCVCRWCWYQVMPLMCDRCRQNFCLRHRHEMDHQCRGFDNTGRTMSSQGWLLCLCELGLKTPFSQRFVTLIGIGGNTVLTKSCIQFNKSWHIWPLIYLLSSAGTVDVCTLWVKKRQRYDVFVTTFTGIPIRWIYIADILKAQAKKFHAEITVL